MKKAKIISNMKEAEDALNELRDIKHMIVVGKKGTGPVSAWDIPPFYLGYNDGTFSSIDKELYIASDKMAPKFLSRLLEALSYHEFKDDLGNKIYLRI